MNPRTEQTSNNLEPLPAEFESDLQGLDARLHQAAKSAAAPVGLADRTFEASVSQLTGSYSLRDRQAATAATFRASWLTRRITGGRLAMAASLLLAVTLSARLILSSGDSHELSRADMTLSSDYLAMNETDWLPTDSSGADEGSIDYLLETGDLTSFNDMQYELASLADDLGM